MNPVVEEEMLHDPIFCALLLFIHSDASSRVSITELSVKWKVPRSTLCRKIEKITEQPNILKELMSELRKQSTLNRPHTHTSVCPFDLEAIYKMYPRQIGKSEGIKRLTRDIKTEEDYASLKKAAENYASFTYGKEEKFIKYFSSFVSEWRDWVDQGIKKYSVSVTPVDLDQV